MAWPVVRLSGAARLGRRGLRRRRTGRGGGGRRSRRPTRRWSWRRRWPRAPRAAAACRGSRRRRGRFLEARAGVVSHVHHAAFDFDVGQVDAAALGRHALVGALERVVEEHVDALLDARRPRRLVAELGRAHEACLVTGLAHRLVDLFPALRALRGPAAASVSSPTGLMRSSAPIAASWLPSKRRPVTSCVKSRKTAIGMAKASTTTITSCFGVRMKEVCSSLIADYGRPSNCCRLPGACTPVRDRGL